MTIKAIMISKNETYMRSWKRSPISVIPEREPLKAMFPISEVPGRHSYK